MGPRHMTEELPGHGSLVSIIKEAQSALGIGGPAPRYILKGIKPKKVTHCHCRPSIKYLKGTQALVLVIQHTEVFEMDMRPGPPKGRLQV